MPRSPRGFIKTNIYITPETKIALDKIAVREGTTAAELTRRVLGHYVAEDYHREYARKKEELEIREKVLQTEAKAEALALARSTAGGCRSPSEV